MCVCVCESSDGGARRTLGLRRGGGGLILKGGGSGNIRIIDSVLSLLNIIEYHLDFFILCSQNIPVSIFS